MPWTGMRILRLVAYGTGPTTVLTVALTAANSFHCAPGRSARSISHPCVAAASHLPCTRPPDTSRCLEYQRLLPKNAYCCLDLCSPFWRTSTTSSRHYSSFSARIVLFASTRTVSWRGRHLSCAYGVHYGPQERTVDKTCPTKPDSLLRTKVLAPHMCKISSENIR